MNKLMKFVYSAVITVIAGAAASYFTRFGIYNWYAALDSRRLHPRMPFFRLYGQFYTF